MCAILGVLSKDYFNQKLFKSMLELMNNRGKDSTGTYFSKDIYLGHKRLAIRDIENGIQPMFYKQYIIVYPSWYYFVPLEAKVEHGRNFGHDLGRD